MIHHAGATADGRPATIARDLHDCRIGRRTLGGSLPVRQGHLAAPPPAAHQPAEHPNRTLPPRQRGTGPVISRAKTDDSPALTLRGLNFLIHGVMGASWAEDHEGPPPACIDADLQRGEWRPEMGRGENLCGRRARGKSAGRTGQAPDRIGMIGVSFYGQSIGSPKTPAPDAVAHPPGMYQRLCPNRHADQASRQSSSPATRPPQCLGDAGRPRVPALSIRHRAAAIARLPALRPRRGCATVARGAVRTAVAPAVPYPYRPCVRESGCRNLVPVQSEPALDAWSPRKDSRLEMGATGHAAGPGGAQRPARVAAKPAGESAELDAEAVRFHGATYNGEVVWILRARGLHIQSGRCTYPLEGCPACDQMRTNLARQANFIAIPGYYAEGQLSVGQTRVACTMQLRLSSTPLKFCVLGLASGRVRVTVYGSRTRSPVNGILSGSRVGLRRGTSSGDTSSVSVLTEVASEARSQIVQIQSAVCYYSGTRVLPAGVTQGSEGPRSSEPINTIPARSANMARGRGSGLSDHLQKIPFSTHPAHKDRRDPTRRKPVGRRHMRPLADRRAQGVCGSRRQRAPTAASTNRTRRGGGLAPGVVASQGHRAAALARLILERSAGECLPQESAAHARNASGGHGHDTAIPGAAFALTFAAIRCPSWITPALHSSARLASARARAPARRASRRSFSRETSAPSSTALTRAADPV
ncbi:uncharacterized protein B0H18DRAFT_953818 [Fomitopsis serialis]|uniref:uncharacterized protein n=1 Tax=Fomitopsis serialis TaxID=139415 RepID=UPI0020076D7D|nr:uncharacterized protein B0H18DRAFT_953818 [Neoantrodia serialis]KAH9928922.1 hypothetical protein B0H18DRAFT_953818 [Neoantrodia serialis]